MRLPDLLVKSETMAVSCWGLYAVAVSPVD